MSELKIFTMKEIYAMSTGDWRDVDDIIHSLHHHGFLAWYENVKELGHAVHSQLWIDDEELGYIINSELSGSMIEEWNDPDDSWKVSKDELAVVVCEYCGDKITNSTRYNSHSKPKVIEHDETITVKEAVERITKAFETDINLWELQTLTEELREEIMNVVINFIQSPDDMM